MASKDKKSRLEQEKYWEEKLSQRLSELSEQGVESGKLSKDTVVKQIRAHIRDTKSRLAVIAAKEDKIAEMSRIKAEKLAAPKVEKIKKKKAEEDTSAESKRQQKKKKKQDQKQSDTPE